MKILAHPGLTQEQRKTGERFKAMMLSLNLQTMRLNAGDSKMSNDEEVRRMPPFVLFLSNIFPTTLVDKFFFKFAESTLAK